MRVIAAAKLTQVNFWSNTRYLQAGYSWGRQVDFSFKKENSLLSKWTSSLR